MKISRGTVIHIGVSVVSDHYWMLLAESHWTPGMA